MLNELEQVLVYGVEWNVNNSNSRLTRIGNKTLHETLPIQSQLKGCIAQANKVMYWLDENDWRWRKEPIKKSIIVSNNTITDELFRTKQYEKAWLKINGIEVQIININNGVANLGSPISDGVYTAEFGAVLSGYDGTVRIYCPEFYIKSNVDGDIKQVVISQDKVDDTYIKQEEVLIDAYKCTVLNTTPTDMGYLTKLGSGCTVSVVNTKTYCRGNSNQESYDAYLDEDPYKTDLGKPRAGLSVNSVRSYANKANSTILTYQQYKNIFYWLYVIEYADFDCQREYPDGLGVGFTNLLDTKWSEYNNSKPIIPCGYGNSLGNRSGIKDIVIPATENYSSDTLKSTRWRGFDNIYGDSWLILDGIYVLVQEQYATIFTCTDPELIDEISSYEEQETISSANGYIQDFKLGTEANIFPIIGTNITSDCYWAGTPSDTQKYLFRVSGSPSNGKLAGLACMQSTQKYTGGSKIGTFRTVSNNVIIAAKPTTKKFLFFNRKRDFNLYLENDLLINPLITFIRDTQEIYVNGSFFKCSTSTEFSSLIEKVQSNTDSITKINQDIEDIMAIMGLIREDIDRKIETVEVQRNVANELQYNILVDGVSVGEINIPKDQFLKSADYNEDTYILTLLFETSSGEKTSEIDLSSLTKAYRAGPGLLLVNLDTFQINIDPTSDEYITVSKDGLKLSGIKEALDSKADKSEIIELDKRITLNTNNIEAVDEKTDQFISIDDINIMLQS